MFQASSHSSFFSSDEDAHELRAAHGGVGIVSVDSHKLRQQLPVSAVLLLKGVEQAVDAGGDKQVLLLQAQQAAVLTGVIGVEDGADGLGLGALGVCQGVVAPRLKASDRSAPRPARRPKRAAC